MPRPLPLSRLTSISIFAPSSPGGAWPDSTSVRTWLIAPSTVLGSPSNVATRAYTSPPWNRVGPRAAYALRVGDRPANDERVAQLRLELAVAPRPGRVQIP